MPWRKYTPEKGKNGRIFHIGKGVVVRKNHRKKWTIFIQKKGLRKNVTVGEGRDGLAKAIKAAEAIAADLDGALKSKPAPKRESHVPKFGVYCREWLDGGKNRWRDHTYERYEQILRLHILPTPDIKDKTLDEFHRRDVKALLKTLLKKKSPATVEATHSVLCGIFEEAVEDEWLQANPARGLLKRLLPKKGERYQKEADPFDREERDLFLDTAERICSRTEVMILKVMVHAGLRLGETLAMREGGLDLQKRTYHVTESFKVYDFDRPKTKNSRRFVDLPDFLVEDLKQYIFYLRKENLKAGKGGGVDLLFPDPGERWKWPYSQRKVQGIMKTVCRKAGLRRRSPHQLRHTYATIMLMAHQSPVYVKKQLGHSSIQVTVDIYGHWISGEGRDGLEEALKPARKPVQKPHTNAHEKGVISITTRNHP